MNANLRYITDASGKMYAVQIPLKEWKILERKLEAADELRAMKKSLTDSLREVKEIRSGKRKTKTIEELLEEV